MMAHGYPYYQPVIAPSYPQEVYFDRTSSKPVPSQEINLPQEISSLHTVGVKGLLSTNKRLLLSGFNEFQSGNFDVTVGLLEAIHKNIMYMATAADYQSNSRHILRENRELISKEDLDDFTKRFPTLENHYE